MGANYIVFTDVLMYRQTVWNFERQERRDTDFVLRKRVNDFRV